MSILIFIVILVVLIVGHEFGHFIVAKLSKMKVLEFGLGFPPKFWSKRFGGTEYSLNAIPFGGFVRIFGEDAKEDLHDPQAFSRKPALHQAGVIVAGPVANFIIAYVFLVAALIIGVPAVVGDHSTSGTVSDTRVVIADVLPESPAARAGLARGDYVVSVVEGDETFPITTPENLVQAMGQATGAVMLRVIRGEESLEFSVVPVAGVVREEPERKAIGVASALIGTVSYTLLEALVQGFTQTLANMQGVLVGLFGLLVGALTFSANLADVAGPVGIASLVGEAALFGAGSLLSFAAIISINLGIINLLPFPALDGGRIAMLGVEAVSRKKISHRVSNTINYVGFVLLIALMVAVTVNDIARLAA